MCRLDRWLRGCSGGGCRRCVTGRRVGVLGRLRPRLLVVVLVLMTCAAATCVALKSPGGQGGGIFLLVSVAAVLALRSAGAAPRGDDGPDCLVPRGEDVVVVLLLLLRLLVCAMRFSRASITCWVVNFLRGFLRVLDGVRGVAVSSVKSSSLPSGAGPKRRVTGGEGGGGGARGKILGTC